MDILINELPIPFEIPKKRAVSVTGRSDHMADRYTRVVLTVIALAPLGLLVRRWSSQRLWARRRTA
jgi:hypothetical protein